jgi:hypothetical protein
MTGSTKFEDRARECNNEINRTLAHSTHRDLRCKTTGSWAARGVAIFAIASVILIVALWKLAFQVPAFPWH